MIDLEKQTYAPKWSYTRTQQYWINSKKCEKICLTKTDIAFFVQLLVCKHWFACYQKLARKLYLFEYRSDNLLFTLFTFKFQVWYMMMGLWLAKQTSKFCFLKSIRALGMKNWCTFYHKNLFLDKNWEDNAWLVQNFTKHFTKFYQKIKSTQQAHTNLWQWRPRLMPDT